MPPDVDGAPEMEETKSSRIAMLPRQDVSRVVSGPQKEIVVRGRKSRSGDRGNKGDGSVVLVRSHWILK
jgi:nuclear pore complex protein Nup133